MTRDPWLVTREAYLVSRIRQTEADLSVSYCVLHELSRTDTDFGGGQHRRIRKSLVVCKKNVRGRAPRFHGDCLMTSNDYFPGSSVVNWYTTAENMLADVLRVVPYCAEHKSVWSPVLVTILQETCSQLDSLWRYQVKRNMTAVGGDLCIKDYFGFFGQCMAPKWMVFWGEEPERIQPFKAWAGLKNSGFKKENYDSVPKLEWWNAYNEVKHNRLENQKKATLGRTVSALAGLFLAILRCPDCRDAILQSEWLSWNIHSCDPRDCLDKDFGTGEGKPFNRFDSVAAETKLFSYPVGWSEREIEDFVWQGDASYRFIKWFHEQANLNKGK